MLISLVLALVPENFRTFDNQFSHHRNYSAQVTGVECKDAIHVHYSKYNKKQTVLINLSLNQQILHVQLKSLNEDFRFQHEFTKLPETKFLHSGCHYYNKHIHVYVRNNVLVLPNVKIPLKSIIYQDSTLDHQYSNTFAGYTEVIKDRSIGFTMEADLQAVYGLPEHTANLNLLEFFKLKKTGHDEFIRLFNMDVFQYELNSGMSIYGNIPFFMSKIKSKANKWFGVLWNNPSDTWIKMSPKHIFMLSESSVFDLYLFAGTPYKILNDYTSVTGKPQLPQLWSLGYHHCRYSFLDQKDITAVHNKFTELSIPLDVLWLDIDYTDKFKFFTWNYELYPNPQELMALFSEHGRYLVTIIDPQIMRDDSFDVYKHGLAQDLFVKTNDSQVFYGDGWSEKTQAVWIDFMNKKAREYWTSMYNYDKFDSSPNTYTWNDMNEPSIFNAVELTLNKNSLHRLTLGNTEKVVEHRQIHNVYGMIEHKSTAIGQVQRDTRSKRPFVLSRAFYAGTQQFGPIWTGDNQATNGHMIGSIKMLLGLNIAGLGFAGADVGGFFGSPSPDLLSRWYQLGAFTPFFRAHSINVTARREPWLYEDKYMKSMNHSITTRYKLLPYIYTQFAHASASGKPIMIPLFFEFDEGYNIEDQFLFGDSILVKGMNENTTSTNVYFPKDTWYSFYDDTTYKAGIKPISKSIQELPVFLRGGHIIPMFLNAKESTTHMHKDPLKLLILLKNGYAKGQIYLDDFSTFDYVEGQHLYKEFVFKNRELSIRKKDIQFKQYLNEFKRGRTEKYTPSTSIREIEIRGSVGVKKITIGKKSIPFKRVGKQTITFKVDLKVTENWKIQFHK